MYSQLKRILLILLWLTCFNAIKGLSEAAPKTIIEKKHFVIENDEPEPIILDCDYDAENYQSSLLVKWLKNGKTIYHWIKGHEPFLYPSFKLLIDEKYEASTDENYKYRAIKFSTPTKELSGNYSCLVTMNTTQTNYIDLQIIDISQLNFEIDSDSSTNETRILCKAEMVYPQPNLVVTAFGDDEDLIVTRISEKNEPDFNGFFNATTTASVNGFDTNDVVSCVLSFPGTEFNMTKNLTSAASIIQISALMFATIIVIFFNII